MEKEGTRGSDESFYKLILVAGDAVLKLAGVAHGFPYELRAETLKEKKVSPDIVGVPLRHDADVVLIEFQGYSDRFVRHRLAGRMAQYCWQKRIQGRSFRLSFTRKRHI